MEKPHISQMKSPGFFSVFSRLLLKSSPAVYECTACFCQKLGRKRSWLVAFLAVWLVVMAVPAYSQKLSPLASPPDWSDLDPYQRTITHDDFLRLLNTIYAPNGAWRQTIEVKNDAAIIHKTTAFPVSSYRLEFAQNAASARPVPSYWTAAGAKPDTGKPLAGYTIALDPGHIGGRWAKMEERWFQIGNAKPVMEGEMTLTTARILADRLTALGAKVAFVRNSTEPVTRDRPSDLRKAALAEIHRHGITRVRNDYDGPNDPLKFNSIKWESELLFYRVSEIRRRAEIVNSKIKPDLTVCLHYNAEDWGNPAQPSLTEKNHMHLLVNGNYGPGELSLDDIRHEMLLKLLNRTAREELPLSASVASALAHATGLPAYQYLGGRARSTSVSPYVWTRNLMANRLYRCPTIYCEPYVMNSQDVFDRVQMGDYEGTRMVHGVERKSIYREYADAVAKGIASYFSERQAHSVSR